MLKVIQAIIALTFYTIGFALLGSEMEVWKQFSIAGLFILGGFVQRGNV